MSRLLVGVFQVFEAPKDFEAKTPVCEHIDVNATVGIRPEHPRRTLQRCDFTYGNYSSAEDYQQYLRKRFDDEWAARSRAVVLRRKNDSSQLQQQQNVAEERGTEDGEIPDSVVDGSRPVSHQAIVKLDAGLQNEAFSTLPDIRAKRKSVEVGLLHRYSLARWIGEEWRVGLFS